MLCYLPGLLADQKEELNLRRFENAARDLAAGTVQKTRAAMLYLKLQVWRLKQKDKRTGFL